MMQRALGNSGLLVSVVGLGTSNFGGRVEPGIASSIVARAVDLGITLFDTADSYAGGRSEETLAAALGERRKQVCISTKWGNVDRGGWDTNPDEEYRCGSRSYILQALEGSLRRLRTDYIDLYQLHMPDFKTPMEETLLTLDMVIRQGKVRYAGVSNMPAWLIVEAQLLARQLGVSGFVSFEDRYSLLARDIEKSLFPAARRYGLGLLPYLPLAEGLLTGKYSRDAPVPEGSRLATWERMRQRSISDANWERLELLRHFAAERGHTVLELAMSWLFAQPVVGSIIAGATRPEQVEQNVGAIGWRLTAQDLATIDRLCALGQ